MKIKVTYPDGTVAVETAFNTVEEAKKALFTTVPDTVRFDTDEVVPVQEEAPKAVEETPKVAKVKKTK